MNAYWSYLAILASEHLLCAQRRLVDGKGELICDTHETITLTYLEKIHDAYFLSDIEQILCFKQPVGGDWLYEKIKSFLNDDPSLNYFHGRHLNDVSLKNACDYIAANSALVFRLAVLEHSNKHVFKRSLFCAWMSLLLFEYMSREEASKRDVFEAAIAHDVGMLDLSFHLIDQNKVMSPIHDVTYYQHAQFGADFMRIMCQSSNHICQAIAQHHEYIDGSGYPLGLSGMRLNELGQIINMFDSLFEVYVFKFKPAGRGLADLVPIVEMNSVTRFGYAAKQLVELLKTGERTRLVQTDAEQIRATVKTMKSLFVYVDHANTIIQQFTNRVGFRHDEKGLSALQNGFFHIALTIHKSPFINHEFIHQMAKASFAIQSENYNDIEDATLMMKKWCPYFSLQKTIGFVSSSL